ncbi:MAG: hypothetical protein ACRC0A_01675 [Chitinophagaceae bacterium]
MEQVRNNGSEESGYYFVPDENGNAIKRYYSQEQGNKLKNFVIKEHNKD